MKNGNEMGGVHRGNRHGRSEQARQSVLQAADGLLVEVGYGKLTIEGIAQRAGVAKQTIYRWWPSKNDILLDAFTEDAHQSFSPTDRSGPADHADLRSELQAHGTRLAAFLTTSDAGAVLRALIAQSQHDPDLAQRLRAEPLARQRAYDRLPFERALARGELNPDTDLDIAADQFAGPIYYRALVTGRPSTPAFIDSLVAAALTAAP